MLDLVENPEEPFSPNEAHIMIIEKLPVTRADTCPTHDYIWLILDGELNLF